MTLHNIFSNPVKLTIDTSNIDINIFKTQISKLNIPEDKTILAWQEYLKTLRFLPVKTKVNIIMCWEEIENMLYFIDVQIDDKDTNSQEIYIPFYSLGSSHVLKDLNMKSINIIENSLFKIQLNELLQVGGHYYDCLDRIVIFDNVSKQLLLKKQIFNPSDDNKSQQFR